MEKSTAPVDKWKLVYIIFYWLGICTLLPWNFFISVPAYWFFKYRAIVENTTMPIDSNTELQDNWNPRLSVASMVPNVTFLTLNAVFGHRFKTKPRLFFSLIMVILFFFYTCIMAKVNTDEWQSMFFNVTLISVVFINTFAAIFQGGLLGVAGKFPGNYIGGVFSGQALGGIFASATNIVMLAFGASDQNSGFYSFIIACVFLLTSLVAFVAVTRTKFYKYYDGEGENKNVLEINPDGDQLMEKAPPPPESSGLKVNPLLVLKEIWVYALSVFLVFVVTLGCFPGITAAIKSTGSGTWSTKFFVPVTCFLTFNVGDFIGRSLAEVLHFPKPHLRGSSWYILMAAVLRVIFIPLFLFCNVSPSNRHMTSVIFESDTIYILLMILFSVSNGYISSICMMSAPGIIKKPEEQSTAASLMVAFLGLGLGVGGALSNVFVLFF
uniref:Uncharacterized protein n=2 Tax=Lepeophtheirus salmonis TaxID=72036 RepID=A0A0K2TVN0_LEPSM